MTFLDKESFMEGQTLVLSPTQVGSDLPVISHNAPNCLHHGLVEISNTFWIYIDILDKFYSKINVKICSQNQIVEKGVQSIL